MANDACAQFPATFLCCQENPEKLRRLKHHKSYWSYSTPGGSFAIARFVTVSHCVQSASWRRLLCKRFSEVQCLKCVLSVLMLNISTYFMAREAGRRDAMRATEAAMQWLRARRFVQAASPCPFGR